MSDRMSSFATRIIVPCMAKNLIFHKIFLVIIKTTYNRNISSARRIGFQIVFGTKIRATFIMPHRMYIRSYGEEPSCKLELSNLEDKFAIAVIAT